MGKETLYNAKQVQLNMSPDSQKKERSLSYFLTFYLKLCLTASGRFFSNAQMFVKVYQKSSCKKCNNSNNNFFVVVG